MELCILQKIVAEVGFGIPIQELFDLAIGTSTGTHFRSTDLKNSIYLIKIGGIIALGLFKMDWSVDDAIREFIRLGEEAFAKRYFLKLPVFKSPAQLLYSYRYTSEGINSALQQAFGPGQLFGYNESTRQDRVMMGVVSSARCSTQPYLFTNYSRNSTGNGE